jgi:glutathione synthase/RimK-type ligase-like ATP-grasp enzyme
MTPGDMTDNTPLDFLVEDGRVRLDLLFVHPGQPLPAALPEHDVAIVAVCQSDRNRPVLAHLEAVLASWPRPVLNRPQAVARCARETALALLDGIPGLDMPHTVRVARDRIAPPGWPFTIRPIDTQAGDGLTRVDDESGLQAFLDAHPDPEFHVARYVDVGSADGSYRKLRIALIDGLPYVCHLAISAHWIVHYRSAAMQASAEKRVEEAAAMQGFDAGFGARHRAALTAIARRLGLDYVVLDCAETRDGRLLLFEADNRGWIHATDPVEIFPYKPAVMRRAFDAFHGLLERRAQRR